LNHWHLRLAVQVLRRNGVVMHATEGVWGLACDPWNPAAVGLLLDLKGRPASKGLIVVAADPNDFAPELAGLPGADRERVLTSWPGAVTWIVPSRRFAPWITGGRDTVAVRVPGHPQARALCRVFGGPLVSTSANRTGRPPAGNRIQARVRLREMLQHAPLPSGDLLYLLPGETLGRGAASEIRTVAGRSLRGGR
jgi:L-threonylcarbamoyladenylate synthase